jgi:hypothetical protein
VYFSERLQYSKNVSEIKRGPRERARGKETIMTTDTYKGVPRLRDGNRVVTGLVSRPSKGCWHGIYEVRENDAVVRRVSGLSARTIQLARKVAARNGLLN